LDDLCGEHRISIEAPQNLLSRLISLRLVGSDRLSKASGSARLMAEGSARKASKIIPAAFSANVLALLMSTTKVMRPKQKQLAERCQY
jgi:hypothetical protein